jgi:hypothetical protein
MGQTSVFLQNDSLQSRLTCPCCWASFGLEQTLSIAEHQELYGDPVLGPEFYQRFPPTRFTLGGDPLDLRGVTCRSVACPHCRLQFPRQMMESPPLFVSILGNAYSGKSFYLTALTWTLRKMLGTQFGLTFRDADLVLNQLIINRESSLFLHPEPDHLLPLNDLISKTQVYEKDLVFQCNRNGQNISYLKPFFFMLGPGNKHPKATKASFLSRVICFYDNAGEHFQAGMDTASMPLTRHLGQANFVMFVYDPTQDPRFRNHCRQDRNYPYVEAQRELYRQELLLHEAANRYRRLTGQAGTAKMNRPLIIVLAKCDIWGGLLPELKMPFWKLKEGQPVAALDLRVVEAVSQSARDLLLRTTPELVDAAEAFSENVTYVPVSALGCLPVLGKGRTHDGKEVRTFHLKPKQIAPKFVEVPFLYGLYRSVSGLVPIIRSKGR